MSGDKTMMIRFLSPILASGHLELRGYTHKCVNIYAGQESRTMWNVHLCLLIID